MQISFRRLAAVALATALALPMGAGLAAAETDSIDDGSVTVVTGSFDDGDVAGSASVTVRTTEAAPTVGVQTGSFEADDMAGSAHVTVPVAAPAPIAPAPAAPAVRVARPAPVQRVIPTIDADVLAELIAASAMTTTTAAVPAMAR